MVAPAPVAWARPWHGVVGAASFAPAAALAPEKRVQTRHQYSFPHASHFFRVAAASSAGLSAS